MDIIKINPPIDLASPALFGNDAGEDEDPELLAAYFVNLPNFGVFFDPQTRLAVIRSRKGMGKSALLNKVAYDREHKEQDLVINVKGSDLTGLGEFESFDPAFLVNQWQQVICARVNVEIGKRLQVAKNDDEMTLVESAELAGFKGRNIVGALMDRMKKKIGPVEFEKLVQANPHALLNRYLHSRQDLRVWVIIDDIDSTFIDTPQSRLRISTFFSACRVLASSLLGLLIRASVRTDVWAAIRRFDESLDKCEQYIEEISWSQSEARQILVNKIYSYLVRERPGSDAFDLNPHSDQYHILRLVFPDRVHWVGSMTATHAVIHVLSAGRPRWSAQLCRLAGKECVSVGGDRISLRHIDKIMGRYGRLRLDDLYREHAHQFSGLRGLVESFSNTQARHTTEQLCNQIRSRYVSVAIKAEGVPAINGVRTEDAIQLAHFLYRIGFISARSDQGVGALRFVRYEQRPDLLKSSVNLDDGMMWEIHPGYRATLGLVKRARRKNSRREGRPTSRS